MSELAEKMGLVPKLRFPEFDGVWERSSIAEMATIHKGKGVSKADVSPTGLVPCIRYGELYTSYGNIIEQPVSRTNLPAAELFLSEAGDVIIPSSGETKEDIATAACVLQSGVALGGDLNVLRSQSDGRWLSYYINGILKSALAKVAQGDSVVHLYPNQIGLISAAFPHITEQRKIAECLQSLDELIAAETEKLEALKRHKKGLLQQLFPAEGETTPRLRFPQLNGIKAWAILPLRQVCPFQRGFDLPVQDIRPGDVPVIYSNGQGKKHNIAMAIAPGIVTGRSGTVGKLHFIENGLYWPHNTTLWVTDFFGNDPSFIYFLLQTVDIGSYSSGSGVPTLNRNDLHEHLCAIPELAEQKAIAGLLRNVSGTLADVESALLLLRTHKAALMQQLFPPLEELDATTA